MGFHPDVAKVVINITKSLHVIVQSLKHEHTLLFLFIFVFS